MKDKSLLRRLTEYSMTPFHMPGHKRAMKKSIIPYGIDITEVEGFDNLHNMQGCLKDVADMAKYLYKSVCSFPLVNGSTCGILASIYTATRENKKILIARNCHKSVYNAIEVLGLDAHYIMPDIDEYGVFGAVTANEVKEYLNKDDIGCVVITTPTYEGVISDAKAIYEVCKEKGAYLVIDSAHGAHFFDELSSCCDMCVVSIHKTLPSLTQTALLNVCSERIDLNTVKHALSVFETSSPSYVLLASIDECLRYVKINKEDFSNLEKNLDVFYEKCKSLNNIKVTHYDDKSKIIVVGNGEEIAGNLRCEKIEPEMVTPSYVLLMATVMDNKKSLDKLYKALVKADAENREVLIKVPKTIPQKALTSSEAMSVGGEYVDLSEGEGKVCLEYVWAYPPGVPLIVPGEVITSEICDYILSRNDLYSTKGKLPEICVK